MTRHFNEVILSFFYFFLIIDIRAGTDEPGKTAVRIVPGHGMIGYPSVLSIAPPETVLTIKPFLSCEGLVVVIEGTLIYLICRFIPSAKSNLASPSIVKCLLASLIGNIISAAAFPVLIAIHDRFSFL